MKFQADTVRAILFDVDGTLYPQTPLRGMIVLELIGAACLRPVQTLRTIQSLQRFRREREILRHADRAEILEQEQYAVVQKKHGTSAQSLRSLVEEWMGRRPLKYLRRVRRPGLETFLAVCRKRGILVGAYSDYPTEAKIKALALDRYFDLHLCSTDGEIDAFKPSARGIRRACEIWGVRPTELLYIGDRPEVDGVAAEAAGCQFMLLSRTGGSGYRTVKNFYELTRMLS